LAEIAVENMINLNISATAIRLPSLSSSQCLLLTTVYSSSSHVAQSC